MAGNKAAANSPVTVSKKPLKRGTLVAGKFAAIESDFRSVGK